MLGFHSVETKVLRNRREERRARLLGGVSALTLLLAGGTSASALQLASMRGGAFSAATAAAVAAAASVQQAQQVTQQSMSSLLHATQAVQAMQQAQAAARVLAQKSTSAAPGLPPVPDGLASGGLVPDSGLAASGVANAVTTWIGANTPVQTSANGQTLVTVQQTQQKAIANWLNFNVGQNTTLYFNQSAGNSSSGNSWIVLNRVQDPTGVPSQILGEIKAEGSVYVIDHNGIVFGGASQVNVNSLIASSLNLFSNDLADSFKNTLSDAATQGTTLYRFLNGGIGDLDSSNVATDSILLTSSAPGAGDITMAAGASINVGSQGLALIAAPNVTNSGTITAPSGQVALVAGIGVSYDYNKSSFDAENSSNSLPQGTNDNSTANLRFANYGGLTDANGNDITPVGTLTNNGVVYTPRGNITLLGGNVAQNGVAVATTSVQQPGSIVVNSQYEVGVNGAKNPADEADETFYTGSVTFGPQAITSILPDTNGATLSSDATSLAPWQNQLSAAAYTTPLPTQGPGLIEIFGQAIDFQSGSLVYAPGQALSADAVVLRDPRPVAPQLPDAGRILLENGAILDVSGIADTELPASANLLTVKLGGNELADDPEQQNGPLYGATITVDMGDVGTNAETGESWVGTPLADLASYANLVQNSIGQLLVNGGAVYLDANEFVGAPGSIVNLTGGYVHYLGGMIDTTRLIGADGGLYGIGNASPDIAYAGIAGQFSVDHTHWGVTETYTSPLLSSGYYQPDYVQGGNAGSLTITVGSGVSGSGAVVLQSTLLAQSVAGLRQIAGGVVPDNGTFSFIGILPIEIGDAGSFSAASGLPATFNASTPLLAALGSNYTVNVFDSNVLDSADFKNIALNAGGITNTPQPIIEDTDTSLSVQPGGAISFTGGATTIEGALVARGGSISITTEPNAGAGIAPSPVPGDILVGSGAVLDVSGFFVNELLLPADQLAPALPINGGSISLIADYGVSNPNPIGGIPNAGGTDLSGNITLAAGSLLNLAGGAHILRNGQFESDSTDVPLGTGGSLTLSSYASINAPLNSGTPPFMRGLLTLDGTISALGFDGGGTLTLQQAAFQIGGDPATAGGAFYFDPKQWGDLGFGRFVLNSVTSAIVPTDAVVSLNHENLVLVSSAIADAPNGADVAAFSASGFLLGTQRSATDLSVVSGLEAIDAIATNKDDSIVIGAGAQILGDPGAAISFSSYMATTVLGKIQAPGGSVSLAVLAPPTASAGGPLYLGADSVIDVSGVAVDDPYPTPVMTAAGMVTPLTGEMLPGGTVNLNDDTTAVLVAPGAVINVSGASGAFDVAQIAPGALHETEILSRQPVWSDAGSVNITAALGLLFGGTLIGEGGAAQAAGGTLTITADPVGGGGYGGSTISNLILVEDTAQAIKDSGASFDFSTYMPSFENGDPPVQQIDPQIPVGAVLFGADSLDRSGFDNLVLKASAGSIGYAGQVSLTLRNSVVLDTRNSIIAANQGNFIWDFSGPTSLPGGRLNPTTDGASLAVTAPYIIVNGVESASSGFPSLRQYASADATLTLNADQIDLSAFISLANIGQATFNSTGDIRLLPAQIIPEQTTQLLGYLETAANLSFNAGDIYPTTDTAFVIQSLGSNGKVTFGYPAGVGPSTATPLSAAGALVVSAANIVQDGEIRAPFGSIILGLPAGTASIADALGVTNDGVDFLTAIGTRSIALGVGSITSVSAGGATIPFGNTIDQETWNYDPATADPDWSGASINGVTLAVANPLTQAPQGTVTLNGASVAFQAGALVDISGGGDLQAQEWISGTGGSRDVLSQYNTSYLNSAAGTQVPLYPDARQIYAIVPGYDSKIAPYDATMSQSGMVPDEQIYLAGGSGLPAGTYTLLPAKYATLPGAFRVVVNSGITNPLYSQTVTLPDGTMEMTGYLTDGFTGAHRSSLSQFYVQSASVWGSYSQYVATSANSFFPAYATLNNLAVPYVPNDAGRLVLAATTNLTLGGSLLGNPGPGGVGSQVDISSQFIEITEGGENTDPGYLGIDAAALDSLGADSLLIGGTRSMTSEGTIITPTANGVIVANDANDPLTAPEILLVAAPEFQTTTIAIDRDGHTASIQTPKADTGLVTFRDGAVVQAIGDAGDAPATTLILGSSLDTLPTLPTSVDASLANSSTGNSTSSTITAYYQALDAALGTLVQLSVGNPDKVQLPTLAQISPGAITVTDNISPSNPAYTIELPSLLGAASSTGAVIQAGASLIGGNVLTLATTGDTTVQSGALLSGANVSVTSNSIAFVGAGATPPASGTVIDAVTLAQFEQSASVNLQSYSAISFDGDVAIQMAGARSALTLGAGVFSSDGGQVSIDAATLTLDNETDTPASAASGTGTLAINAGELVFGGGDKSLQGFGSVSIAASQGIVGQGTGSMDFGALSVTLQTPILVAGTSSTQTLTTTGALSVVPVDGAAPVSSETLGGAIILQGGSVSVSVPVQAIAGNISLIASSGDVTVTGTGALIAHGAAKQFGSTAEYASAGNITLSADKGTVDIASGAVVDFAGAPGGGNGGSLTVTTGSTAPVILDGRLLGATVVSFSGSSFSLNTAGAADLDSLAQILTGPGVTGDSAFRPGRAI